jgi:SAM-dependent methyltransferase
LLNKLGISMKEEPLRNHWLWKMNEEHSQFFLQIMEKRLEETGAEVDALMRIFSSHKITSESTILDVFCLLGKRAVALAERGYRVVGVDISPTLIRQANGLARSRNLQKTEFIQGDIRHILRIMENRRRSFDIITYMYGYIGSFGQEPERKILRQLHALVSDRGFLVLEAYNRDYVVRHIEKAGIRIISPDLEYHVQRRLNLETSDMENDLKLYSKKDNALHCRMSIEVRHRIYSLHELICLLKEAGWTNIESFGGFELEQPTMDSSALVMVAGA